MSRRTHRVAAVASAALAAAPGVAYADNCGSLSDCYQTIAAAIAVAVAIAVVISVIAFLPEILAAIGIGAEVVEAGAIIEGAGPWIAEAANIAEGGAVAQSLGGSCVAACGEMLSGGALTEAQLLAQISEWSNPAALAEALNAAEGAAAWQGGYFASAADALAAAEQGPMAAVLQAPGLPAHMVVIEPLEEAGAFLVRDPAIGGTYEVLADWILKYVSGGVW